MYKIGKCVAFFLIVILCANANAKNLDNTSKAIIGGMAVAGAVGVGLKIGSHLGCKGVIENQTFTDEITGQVKNEEHLYTY